MNKTVFFLTFFLICAGNMNSSGQIKCKRISKESYWAPKDVIGSVENMEYREFDAQRIGEKYGFLLYFPPAYHTEPGRHFPVMYYMAGISGLANSIWTMMEILHGAIETGEAPQMIVVSCTDPTCCSMWCNVVDGSYPVESVLINDLIPHIDTTCRTIPHRRARVASGFSMGGFGAFHMAFKYPHLFGVVDSYDAAIFSTESFMDGGGRNSFETVWKNDETAARADNPYDLAKNNRETITDLGMHIRFFQGRIGSNSTFDRHLMSLGIEHTFHSTGCGHSQSCVLGTLDKPFAFYTAAFAGIDSIEETNVEKNTPSQKGKVKKTSLRASHSISGGEKRGWKKRVPPV
jgi:endo-1,4-beta-xylanase